MLFSLSIILLLGMFLGWIFKKIRLPSLLGMILTGVLIGPYALNLIDISVLNISTQLRQIALVIILTRAGLSLDVAELKKVGRPALLMCFLPATFEIAGTVLLAPLLFGISYAEAALTGAVIAAVSPAVVVPRMLKLIDEGYGAKHRIPQIILSGASADDVYVIVLFTAFSSMLTGQGASALDFVQIPTSILLGIIVGALAGIVLTAFFRRVHIRDSAKLIIIMSVSFLLLALEGFMTAYVHISGLIAVMALGMTIFSRYDVLAKRLSVKYGKLWIAAEIVLFVLVGATVNIADVTAYGTAAVLLVLGALVFRMCGVLVSLIKTPLTVKERLFCMLAYTPKATVQAAIGALPLAMGLECGGLILTVAVLSILITAPLGAFAIDVSYKRLLDRA